MRVVINHIMGDMLAITSEDVACPLYDWFQGAFNKMKVVLNTNAKKSLHWCPLAAGLIELMSQDWPS